MANVLVFSNLCSLVGRWPMSLIVRLLLILIPKQVDRCTEKLDSIPRKVYFCVRNVSSSITMV